MKTINRFNILAIIGILFFMSSCAVEDLEFPDTDPRDEFTGTWNCNDNQVKSTLDSYDVTIKYDPSNSSQVLLENFGFLGQDAQPYALITGSLITIPEQVTGDDYTVSGEGKLIDENTIDWAYSINDGADLINYEAVYTR